MTIDGARVEFPDGWFLVRASNTEPSLTTRFEAETPERLEEIKAILRDALRQFPEVSGEFLDSLTRLDLRDEAAVNGLLADSKSV